MERELYTRQSANLGTTMNVLSFGSRGYPVVIFPTKGAGCDQWEQFGMIDELSPLVDEGRIRLFCVDTVDTESWICANGNKEWRTERQESYYHYICDELLPLVHEVCGNELRPLACGVDLGATHAAIVALRRPDLFEGCIALSGVYRTSYYFGDWMNPTLYDNDITAFLSNMEPTHEYVDLYNARQLVFCVGQGPWEDGISDLRVLSEEFDRLGVSAWCDFWGFDVSHDWPWWKKQLDYFLPIVLDELDKTPEVVSAKKDRTALEERVAAKKRLAKTRIERDDECAVIKPLNDSPSVVAAPTRSAHAVVPSAKDGPSRIATAAALAKAKKSAKTTA